MKTKDASPWGLQSRHFFRKENTEKLEKRMANFRANHADYQASKTDVNICHFFCFSEAAKCVFRNESKIIYGPAA